MCCWAIADGYLTCQISGAVKWKSSFQQQLMRWARHNQVTIRFTLHKRFYENVSPEEWRAETIMVVAGWPETNDWEEVGETSVPGGVVITKPAAQKETEMERITVWYEKCPVLCFKNVSPNAYFLSHAEPGSVRTPLQNEYLNNTGSANPFIY